MPEINDKQLYRTVAVELPLNNEHWIVVGIVNFQQSQESQSYKTMKVAFAKVKEKRTIYADGVMHEYTKDFKYSWQLASNIAIFQSGSIWTRVGSNCTCIHYPRKSNFSSDFHNSFVEETLPVKQLIKECDYRFGQVAFSHYLPVKSPTHLLLIPCTDILRVEYGFSGDLVQAVLGNWLELQPYRLYQADKSSSGLENETGIPHLHLAKNVSHNPNFIKTLANLVFDDSARKRIKRAYSSLVSNHNSRFHTTTLSIKPISTERVSLNYLGTMLPAKVDGRTCIIVHNILEWNATLPITDVSYASDLDYRQGYNKDDDLPLKQFPTRRRFDEDLDVPLHLVKRDSLADNNKEKYRLHVPLPLLRNMHNVALNKAEKELQSCKGETSFGGLHDDPSVSGGERKSDEEKSAPFDIDDQQNDEDFKFSATEDMVKFAMAIKELQEQLLAIEKLESIQVTSFKKASSLVLEQVELPDSPIYINALSNSVDGTLTSFSWIDKDERIRRAYLIFIVKLNKSEFLIVESQRTKFDKPIATYILSKKEHTPFSKEDIKSLVASIAVNGPSILPRSVLSQFNRKQVNHLENDTPKDVARRMKNSLLDAVVFKRGRLIGHINRSQNSLVDLRSPKKADAQGMSK